MVQAGVRVSRRVQRRYCPTTKTFKIMKVQISITNGTSDVMDFDDLTFQDLKVLIKYCDKIQIERKD